MTNYSTYKQFISIVYIKHVELVTVGLLVGYIFGPLTLVQFLSHSNYKAKSGEKIVTLKDLRDTSAQVKKIGDQIASADQLMEQKRLSYLSHEQCIQIINSRYKVYWKVDFDDNRGELWIVIFQLLYYMPSSS